MDSPFIQRINEYSEAAKTYEAIKQALKADMPRLFLVARKQTGLTQRELAALLGVSFSYISKIEHGHMMPSDELLAHFQHILAVDHE
jgi:ribosome-binding protein aMBF1 (putative translation factor)